MGADGTIRLAQLAIPSNPPSQPAPPLLAIKDSEVPKASDSPHDRVIQVIPPKPSRPCPRAEPRDGGSDPDATNGSSDTSTTSVTLVSL